MEDDLDDQDGDGVEEGWQEEVRVFVRGGERERYHVADVRTRPDQQAPAQAEDAQGLQGFAVRGLGGQQQEY